ILAALGSRRPARNQHALVKAGTRFGHGRGGQIHVDVVGDEKVETPVAVVVDESAACVPARAFARHAGLLAHIDEGSISVIVIEDVLAVVGYEDIVPAVVVVIITTN